VSLAAKLVLARLFVATLAFDARRCDDPSRRLDRFRSR